MTKQSVERSARSAGRPREFDMDAALDAALIVFSERGYQATSISDLTTATGLTAGSIYKAFGDKRGVFLGAFDRYWSVRNALIQRRLATLATGREKVRAILAHYAESSHGAVGRRGCLVVGGANDLSLLDAEAAAHVNKAFAANHLRLKEQIVAGQLDGSVRKDLDADTAARSLLCLSMGMRVVGKTGQTTESDMYDVADMAMKLLD
ncbi:TetR/AcrR family transcriptional regulator [Rhizobium oryziradicis]|uniref:TetR family transcriptional regulator n=1 Tax=Rhizobium oryziradicis TaxID=1867956 RepID=A0A1Q8ZRA1_9HYPH|nr:TetR/AcrR family transcriptional regulator [Rhizobium oryziradicis]OLP44586.1 TetR family transcriptional regulator [Rhizobium oryziradicis]